MRQTWKVMIRSQLALAFVLAIMNTSMGYAQADCEPVDGVVPICGLVGPEDLERTPDNRYIVISSMGSPGGLLVLDPQTDALTRIYGEGVGEDSPEPGWGDPACTAAPDWVLSHGIDVRVRADGRWQVLVVNHQQRESVEFFELLPGDPAPTAVWRGCVSGPDNANFNDTVALADGGFLVTHMADQGLLPWQLLRAVLGFDTGFLYRWSPETGFAQVPNTQARFPNGVSLAPDGQSFYLNDYFGNTVRRHNLETGELLAQAEVMQTDNGAWTEGGKLLVASHPVSVLDLVVSLGHGFETPSLLPFDIVELDPETLASRLLISREGPPMGAGTVALQHGDFLYIGSYLGDRLIKVPLN